ncbi:phenylacetate--CoA ligase family protein [Patescibacteria group bacterium]|nr:phenylacetate--CoA ligase family protein [Patescibacteria group bacterium]
MKWTDLSYLTRDQIKQEQNKMVAYFFSHELPYSPYYRELFKKNNLKFSDIKTTDDLQKIPFTSKLDIAPTEDDRAKPRQFILQPDEKLIKKYASKGKLLKILFGKLTGQDVKRKLEREYKPIHIHFTTGRSALPVAFVYSAKDVDLLKESGERMLDVAKISRDDVAINAFPYAPHLAFWLAYNALTHLGMTSVQTGGGKIMGTTKIINVIERMKAGLLVIIPGYCYHLMRQAVKEKRDFSGLKTVITGGERASAGYKEKLKGLLSELGAKDVKVLSTYAFTEGKTAWVQCHEKSGYHLYPDLGFFEVVDKDGKRVKDGEPGELVYTSLGWNGTVVVRYKTGDMTDGIEYDKCQYCGKTVPRIKMDLQRNTDIKEFQLTKVKGELVNLNDFYPILSGIKELEEWQVEIRKKNNDPYEIDEIVLYLVFQSGVNYEDLAARIGKEIKDQMFITVITVQKPLNELLEMLGMETELKEKRIVDNRPQD